MPLASAGDEVVILAEQIKQFHAIHNKSQYHHIL